jgi:hypothetical protein
MDLKTLNAWILRGAIALICFLLIDIHRDFKTVLQDVNQLKVTVEKHDYILNLKQKNDKRSMSFYLQLDSAVLPDTKIKVKNIEKPNKS